MDKEYSHRQIEAVVQKTLAGRKVLLRPGVRFPPQALLPVDAALPFRAPAHGARAQLLDRRRPVPLPAHERLQCPAADGLGRLRAAGRERRHRPEAAPGRMDPRQHRADAHPDPPARIRDRLAAGTGNLRPVLLPLGAAAVPAHAGKGHRLPGDRPGQLGSGRQHSAGQRAGDRRLRLAHRRTGGAPGNTDVVFEDHRLRRGTARRPRGAGVAGGGKEHAAQLDRQVHRDEHLLRAGAAGARPD